MTTPPESQHDHLRLSPPIEIIPTPPPPPTEAALEAAGEFVYVEWDSGAPPDEPEEDDTLNFYVGEMGVLFEENHEAREMHEKLVADLAQRFDAYAAPLEEKLQAIRDFISDRNSKWAPYREGLGGPMSPNKSGYADAVIHLHNAVMEIVDGPTQKPTETTE